MLTFVELCAGTAAVSLRLHHPRARPPVSRMGAKTGYANVILRCLGLRPGQGADRYVWCEPDRGVRLLLHAMTSREIATKAAAIIASWKDEDPKALWQRLRAEGPAVVDDARAVDPREVARWSFVHQGSFQYRGADAGIGRPQGRNSGGGFGSVAPVTEMLPRLFAPLPTLPAIITDDARKVDPPQLPPGVVAYIDPPYLNTTGYAHAFPRSEWLPIVRRWVEAGALVCVSEAEPIPDLMAEGWHAVEITGERVGQKRTFSKQQREWLTMSRPPAWRPSIQGKLFT